MRSLVSVTPILPCLVSVAQADPFAQLRVRLDGAAAAGYAVVHSHGKPALAPRGASSAAPRQPGPRPPRPGFQLKQQPAMSGSALWRSISLTLGGARQGHGRDYGDSDYNGSNEGDGSATAEPSRHLSLPSLSCWPLNLLFTPAVVERRACPSRLPQPCLRASMPLRPAAAPLPRRA